MRSTVVWFVVAASALGAAGMFAGSRRTEPRVRRQRWIKFATYMVVTNGMLLAAAAGATVLALAVAAMVVVGALELARLRYPTRTIRAAIGAGYVVAGLGTLRFAMSATADHAIFVYVIVATFDGFSQVAGQWFGAHRLAPAISPGKSIEGAIGGAVVAAGAAVWLRPLIDATSVEALGVALTLAVSALTGDLAASAIKRSAGVKDFGDCLPGHGGILDRFDSFLAAATVALCLLPLR